MIGRVLAIAITSFREAIRKRLLYAILAVVVLFNLFASVLGEMSLHQEARIARDVALAGVSGFGSIAAIILGSILLYDELAKRTIHTIISKPIERYEFVIGKYAGMALTLTILTSLFAGSALLMLSAGGTAFSAAMSKAVLLAYFEVLVVAAIAVFFSSFSTPFLSGIFTFAIFFVGRVTPEMRAAVKTAKAAWIRDISNVALYVVPDLHIFSVSGGTVRGEHVTVHSEFVDWSYLLTAGAYAAACIAVFLIVASLIFSRRDFV